jgi:hypothetical protein
MSVSKFVKSWFKILTKKKPLAVVVAPAVVAPAVVAPAVVAPAVEPKIFNKKTDAEIAEDEIWEKKWTDKRIKAAEIHKDIANGYLSVDGTRVKLEYALFECFNIINYGDREKFYCGGWIECHSTWNLEIRKSKICKNDGVGEDDIVRMLYGFGYIFLEVQDLRHRDETKFVNFTFSKELTIEGLRKVRDKSPKIWERLLKDDMDGPICDEILQYIVYGDVLWG